MNAKLHFLPAMMVGAALLLSAQSATTAPRPPSLANLKGKYDGVYTSNSGPQGTLRLTISQDKKMRNSALRSLKAVAKFGNKSYKLNGSFEPATNIAELSAVIGRRPPNITMVTVTGTVDNSGTTINGGYTITSFTSNDGGSVSVSR